MAFWGEQVSRRGFLIGAVVGAGVAGAAAEALTPGGIIRRLVTKEMRPTDRDLIDLVNQINMVREENGAKSLDLDKLLTRVAQSAADSVSAIDPIARDRRTYAPQIATSVITGVEQLFSGYSGSDLSIYQNVMVFSSGSIRDRNYPLIDDFCFPNNMNAPFGCAEDGVEGISPIFTSSDLSNIGVGGAIDKVGNRTIVIVAARAKAEVNG